MLDLLAALAACDRPAKLAPLASDAVVLAFGDSLTYGTGAGVPGETSAQAAGNVREMVELARGRGIDAEIAGDLRVPYEGAIITDVLRDKNLKSDSVHPNARGYRLIAERIAERLKRAGAIGRAADPPGGRCRSPHRAHAAASRNS